MGEVLNFVLERKMLKSSIFQNSQTFYMAWHSAKISFPAVIWIESQGSHTRNSLEKSSGREAEKSALCVSMQAPH